MEGSTWTAQEGGLAADWIFPTCAMIYIAYISCPQAIIPLELLSHRMSYELTKLATPNMEKMKRLYTIKLGYLPQSKEWLATW
jgi:hypothetical protein